MKSPKIIEGKAFDWKAGAKALDRMSEDFNQGKEPSMWDAMGADPGVTKCPKCEVYYWNEGTLVECLDCGTQWRP